MKMAGSQQQVSILLVVELAFEDPLPGKAKGMVIGFNPSCSGIGF